MTCPSGTPDSVNQVMPHITHRIHSVFKIDGIFQASVKRVMNCLIPDTSSQAVQNESGTISIFIESVIVVDTPYSFSI